MKKEYHHETFWTRFLTAALVVYLLRVLLIAGEGKGCCVFRNKGISSALVSGGGQRSGI